MGSARDPLSDVPPGEAFHTCNGVVLNNLVELSNYLQGCSEYDFRYHVNSDHHKNDFSIWIRESVGDELLARDLDGELRQDAYLKVIRDRINAIERGDASKI